MSPVSMTITVNEAGQVSVTGPLDNQLVCYGLLECGKDALRNHFATAAQRIQPVSPADVRTLSLSKA